LITLYNTYQDEQLLPLLRESNEGAFTEIYQRYWDKLLVVAMHRLGNMDEAREVVQDIFFNLWRRRATFRLEYSLNTYLSVAVKYEVLNRLAVKHRQQRFQLHISRHWEAATSDTENQISFKELQEQLASLVKALPEKCRIIFQMSREKGYPRKKIASELGIAEKTVEAHLSTALRKLRSGLSHLFTLLLTLLFLSH
jgi:RNA polymerase sigma-70 factor (ECF subfamily)